MSRSRIDGPKSTTRNSFLGLDLQRMLSYPHTRTPIKLQSFTKSSNYYLFADSSNQLLNIERFGRNLSQNRKNRLIS
jgi:hypothetical protein